MAGGGLLVLTNSPHRLKYGTGPGSQRGLGRRQRPGLGFRITYEEGTIGGYRAKTEGEHPWSQARTLELGEGNGVPFGLDGAEWQVLAEAGGQPVVALVDYGSAGGQVLALADVAILSAGWSEITTFPFWRNLARYARSR